MRLAWNLAVLGEMPSWRAACGQLGRDPRLGGAETVERLERLRLGPAVPGGVGHDDEHRRGPMQPVVPRARERCDEDGQRRLARGPQQPGLE